MIVKDADITTIAKPVPSRPCCCFKSFSEILDKDINACPPISRFETKFAIRPKTVRFKPPFEKTPHPVLSSQGDTSQVEASDISVDFLKSDLGSKFLYRPMEKLVSRSTASILTNMGNGDIINGQESFQLQAQAQDLDQVKHNIKNVCRNNGHKKTSSEKTKNQMSGPLKVCRKEENQSALLTSDPDKQSYDGFSWRKYGQKQVKGRECPRSYFKCTHPNCPLKKKVERSLDGKITEIVYKDEHNHPMHQSPRHQSGTQEQGQSFFSDRFVSESGDPLCSISHGERTIKLNRKTENGNEIGSSMDTTVAGELKLQQEPEMDYSFSNLVGTSGNSFGAYGGWEEGSNEVDANVDMQTCKRRKKSSQANELDTSGVEEPHNTVESSTESKIVGDGFRWRKYGRKVVKGNPFPRSYYRCTSHKCNARKHVERALDDPRAFLTTYEGKHNHEMPVSRSLNGVCFVRTSRYD